jgi:hypothetical protein
MRGLFRYLANIVAIIALLAVPLGEAAGAMLPAMIGTVKVVDSDSQMNCKSCGQPSAASAVCAANSCAIIGIVAEAAIAVERLPSAFFIARALALEEFTSAPPTPPA